MLLIRRSTDEAQRPASFGTRVVVLAVEGADSLGNMMAGVGDGELTCVTASASEAAANIAAGSR